MCIERQHGQLTLAATTGQPLAGHCQGKGADHTEAGERSTHGVGTLACTGSSLHMQLRWADTCSPSALHQQAGCHQLLPSSWAAESAWATGSVRLTCLWVAGQSTRLLVGESQKNVANLGPGQLSLSLSSLTRGRRRRCSNKIFKSPYCGQEQQWKLWRCRKNFTERQPGRGMSYRDCSPERYNRVERAGRHRCFNTRCARQVYCRTHCLDSLCSAGQRPQILRMWSRQHAGFYDTLTGPARQRLRGIV